MSTASVVRIRRRADGTVVTDCDVYIGRAMYQGGWRLPASKWANPFPVRDKTDASRRRAIAAYEAHVRASPELMAALPELRGQRLGCWCRPLPCHGDVLVRLLAEQDASAACAETRAAVDRDAASRALAAALADMGEALDGLL